MFRFSYSNVVGCHECIVRDKQKIFLQIGVVNNFGSFEIILFIIGSSGDEMPHIVLVFG